MWDCHPLLSQGQDGRLAMTGDRELTVTGDREVRMTGDREVRMTGDRELTVTGRKLNCYQSYERVLPVWSASTPT